MDTPDKPKPKATRMEVSVKVVTAPGWTILAVEVSVAFEHDPTVMVSQGERGVWALPHSAPNVRDAMTGAAAVMVDIPTAAYAAWKTGWEHKPGEPWRVQAGPDMTKPVGTA